MNADVNGLTDGTAYQFNAVVTNAAGNSATSDAVSATPEPPVPVAPTITATAGDGKANFTITKVDNASGYHIWSKATSDNWAAKPTQTLDANTFTGEIDGLTNGTPYTLAVSAFNDSGESDYNADGASTHVTPTAPNVAVTGVDVQPATASVDVGKTQQLTLTVTPNNATNKSVTYKSSDDTIATVDDKGLVTGVKAGTVTITASSVDGNKQATSAITVNAPK
ncbi:hypothetical protein CLI91_03985 [Lentilactobacillus hilgardii]|nr:hypothetical protein [Lentilactobacillus hilgardii]MBZ2204602.1 hypothetical protein [Lentilactobacillus hilgardii]